MSSQRSGWILDIRPVSIRYRVNIVKIRLDTGYSAVFRPDNKHIRPVTAYKKGRISDLTLVIIHFILGGTFFARKMREAEYVTMIDPFTLKYGKWGALQVRTYGTCLYGL